MRNSQTEGIAMLTGGLGNQFFQVCHAIRGSESASYQFISRNYRQDNTNTQDIDAFNIRNVTHAENQIKFGFLSTKISNLILRFSNRGNQELINILTLKTLQTLLTLSLSISNNRLIKVNTEISDQKSKRGLFVFLGYFQGSENSNSGREIELLRSATLKNHKVQKMIQEKYEKNQTLVIHVRKGDYSFQKNSKFGILDRDYYERAIRFVSQASNFEEVNVYSDDIHYAKNLLVNLLPLGTVWIESVYESTAATFESMRYATTYILANSSFSWWAARLCVNEMPLVVYPEPWFKGQFSPLESPQNWHGIKSFKDSN